MFYITLPSDMLWQDASEDDYDADATETAFADALNRALYKAGYDDVEIDWDRVMTTKIKDEDGEDVHGIDYDAIRGVIDSINPEYIERQDSIEDPE